VGHTSVDGAWLTLALPAVQSRRWLLWTLLLLLLLVQQLLCLLLLLRIRPATVSVASQALQTRGWRLHHRWGHWVSCETRRTAPLWRLRLLLRLLLLLLLLSRLLLHRKLLVVLGHT